MGSFPSALRPGDHAGEIEKKEGSHSGNTPTTTTLILPEKYDESGERTQYIHPRRGDGSAGPLRRGEEERGGELRVPVNKVAPFENGKPSIEEYDYIYGCFLEEDVSSDDDDGDDKHESKNTTITNNGKKGKKKKKKKSKHSIFENSFLKSLLTPKNVSSEEKESLPGKLYRLVKESWGVGASGGGGASCSSSSSSSPFQRWFFYNDTKDLKMVVTGYFGASSELRANDNTNMWREMPTGFVIAELVIPPLSTLGFIEGSVRDGYDLRFHALPA